MNIEFFLPMIPPTATAQEHKITKTGHFYDPPELKAAKAKFRDSLAPHAPPKPLNGALRLITKWLFPFTGEHTTEGEWKITDPDTDNLIKAFKDEMAKLHFFKNDSHVASEITEKFYSGNPGIYVCLYELEYDS